MENIGAFLKQIVERNAQKPALRYGPAEPDEVWTYQELWTRSSMAARWLQAHGIEKGDRIVIWAPNRPWWVGAYFGALRAGATLVPLDVRSGDDFVRQVVSQTEPKLAIVAESTRSQWQGEAPTVTLEEFAALPDDPTEPQDVNVAWDDIAEIVFTSGTTGNPKGVMLSHGNILFDVEATDKYVPDTPHFRTVSILPLSHMFEQSVGLLMALKRDASIYYLSSIQPSTIFGALKTHGATTLLLVPQALRLFMSTIEREAAKQGKEKSLERTMKMAEHLPLAARRMLFHQVHERLGGMLEFLVSGAAPIDPDLVHKWEMLGIPIIQGYGMTETCAAVSASQMSNRNPQTVGKPIPGVEVKVAPDGELLVRGGNVMKGYWHNPQATADVFDDGWYKTGDLGYLDDKGLLYIRGRKKDLIVLPNGKKVYPQDVEQVLLTLPGVANAVVLGLPTNGSQHDVQVHAVLILTPDAPSPEAIVKQANARLQPHQYILGYTVWPGKEFPQTHTLKVKKQEVLASLLAMRAERKEAVAAGTI